MNDKIIINTIEKIHFIITSFLSFIFIILFSLFVLFQNGVYINDISLPNLKIKKLYIKYNEKINITLEELNIDKQENDENTQIDYKQIDEIFKTLILFENFFEKIIIKKISYNDISGSFKYIYGQNGFLLASSDAFKLKSSIRFESNMLNIRIDDFKDLKRDIKINGNIILNTKDVNIINKLDINIHNEALLRFYAILNPKKFSYSIKSLKKIKNIKHTIALFDLDKEIKYWVFDAIKMSDANIDSLYGWVDYNHLETAYKNLFAKVTINNVDYIYDTKLEAVHSKKTIVTFKDGILYIKPQNTTSYDFSLDKSWLKIDFTKKEELLTLYLLFDGFVNKDLLYLLKHYNIDLPFLQNSGKVRTDLKLEVGLRNINIDAKGKFFTKEANFTYLGLDIDIFDASIYLDNYDVSINKMLSKYKDIATAVVDVDFNAKNTKGNIVFDIQDINFKNFNLNLKKENKPTIVTYKISPNQDVVYLDKTSWNLDNKLINVDALNIPFNLEKLYADIPTTFVKMQDIASAYVSGEIFLKSFIMNLDIDLLKFSINNLTMTQSLAPIKIIYDKKISIKTDEAIRLKIGSQECILDNTLADIEDNNIKIRYSALEFNDLVDTMLNGEYNFKTNTGVVNLQNIKFKNKKIGEIFSDEENLKIDISSKLHEIKMNLKKLDIEYILRQQEWKLKFNSIYKISKKSKILKDYKINNGSFIIYKNSSEKDMRLIANTIYPYEFIVTDNKPTNSYNIKGKIDDKTNALLLNVNNQVDIKIDKEIRVTTKDIGINLNAIFDFLKDKDTTPKDKSSNQTNIFLDAKNSYLYLDKNRHIISDSIKLQYFNNIFTAQLTHKKGHAGFKFNKNKFHLYGENFGDEFMKNFFNRSDFKNGKLSFSMEGSTTQYDGVFHIEDTTIKDYKILNNVLAFVNTIPSLITFSLPGYSSKGLKVDNGYIYFNFKDDIYNISDIKINSQELNILGKGEASIANNTINLKLNLKTDLGSSISKIPVVGYILLGKDSISTSLGVTGKLDNPDINTLIAKDIIVAPFNIIKRTLLFPLRFIESDKKKED